MIEKSDDSIKGKNSKKPRGGLPLPPPRAGRGEKMEKTGGLGGRGRSVGVIGSNVAIQRFNTLV